MVENAYCMNVEEKNIMPKKVEVCLKVPHQTQKHNFEQTSTLFWQNVLLFFSSHHSYKMHFLSFVVLSQKIR